MTIQIRIENCDNRENRVIVVREVNRATGEPIATDIELSGKQFQSWHLHGENGLAIQERILDSVPVSNLVAEPPGPPIEPEAEPVPEPEPTPEPAPEPV